jgi:HSP20 family protein
MHAMFWPAGESTQIAPWRPAADIYRTEDGYLIKLDLAGVRPEDIHITLSGYRMTVHGVRRDCTAHEGCSYYQLEIAYSRFERTFELPCRLDQARVETQYQDGMLLVHVAEEGDAEHFSGDRR